MSNMITLKCNRLQITDGQFFFFMENSIILFLPYIQKYKAKNFKEKQEFVGLGEDKKLA